MQTAEPGSLRTTAISKARPSVYRNSLLQECVRTAAFLRPPIGRSWSTGINGGANGRDKRPAFDRLLRGVARKEFDVIAAWSVDRLGRSLQDLVGFLGELHAKGVDLYLHRQGLDTGTPAGKAMFQMLGVFAEFERAIIRERVTAGLTRARAQGKRLGRPSVRPATEAAIRAALHSGKGIRRTAADLRVGISVVQRVKAAMTRQDVI